MQCSALHYINLKTDSFCYAVLLHSSTSRSTKEEKFFHMHHMLPTFIILAFVFPIIKMRLMYSLAGVWKLMHLNPKPFYTFYIWHMHPETHTHTHTRTQSVWAASPVLWNILHPTCLYNSLSTSSSWSLITLSLYPPLGKKNTPPLLSLSLSLSALCNRAWFRYTQSIKGANHCDEIRLQQIPSLLKISCC